MSFISEGKLLNRQCQIRLTKNAQSDNCRKVGREKHKEYGLFRPDSPAHEAPTAEHHHHIRPRTASVRQHQYPLCRNSWAGGRAPARRASVRLCSPSRPLLLLTPSPTAGPLRSTPDPSRPSLADVQPRPDLRPGPLGHQRRTGSRRWAPRRRRALLRRRRPRPRPRLSAEGRRTSCQLCVRAMAVRLTARVLNVVYVSGKSHP